MYLLLLTIAIFAIAMTVMSVGVIFSGRCLRGSCGGPEVLGADGAPVTCATCPNKDKKKTESDSSLTSIGVAEG